MLKILKTHSCCKYSQWRNIIKCPMLQVRYLQVDVAAGSVRLVSLSHLVEGNS